LSYTKNNVKKIFDFSKLPVKDKIFWKNFFQGVLIFVGAWLLLGLSPTGDAPNARFGLRSSYDVISALAIIYLCAKISLDFSKEEKN